MLACLFLRFFLLLLLWRKEGGGGEVVYGDVSDLCSSRVVFGVFAWIPSRRIEVYNKL